LAHIGVGQPVSRLPPTDSFDKLRTGSGARFSRTGLFRQRLFVPNRVASANASLEAPSLSPAVKADNKHPSLAHYGRASRWATAAVC